MSDSAKEPFAFLALGRLVDGDLELVLVERMPADPAKGRVPQYQFEMRRPGSPEAMGTIRLRIASARTLREAGHIGYWVAEEHRGHRYAARSCQLLLPLARAHGLKAVWLTVDPHNGPSLKTCRIVGAKWVDTVRLPKDHPMYAQGARYRRRFRLGLTKMKRTEGSVAGVENVPRSNVIEDC